MNYNILTFIKLGDHKHIVDLYENGTVYINTIQHFRKIEDQELRGDRYEGVSRIINSLPGTFKIPGIDKEFNFIKAHIREAYDEVLGNIYSLYCISSKGFPNPLDFKLDEKNLRFGSHGLFIKEPGQFISRIECELKRTNYKFRHGFINYYDKDNINSSITLFDKPLEFEYQKEFRFYVENDQMNPIKIQIGSMKEYAEIYKIEDLLELSLNYKS